MDIRLFIAASAAIFAGLAAFALIEAMAPADRRRERIDEVIGDSRVRKKRRERIALSKISTSMLERFDIGRAMRLHGARERLVMSGRRTDEAYAKYVFTKMFAPVLGAGVGWLYAFHLKFPDLPFPWSAVFVIAVAVGSFLAPDWLVEQGIRERRSEIRAAWADALDMLLIIVEGEATLEAAIRAVAAQIDERSRAVAEEFAQLIAELDYLPDRRRAFENLAHRTGLPEVRSACMALIQADEKGTPIADTLRILGDEARSKRLNEAQRRGAKMGTLMVVPTFVFFIFPVLVLTLAPALMHYIGVD